MMSRPAATATAGTVASRQWFCAGRLRGEHGKLLGQLLRAAMRAGGFARPFRGTNEQLEILLTFRADKFVEWHVASLPHCGLLSSSLSAPRLKARGALAS